VLENLNYPRFKLMIQSLDITEWDVARLWKLSELLRPLDVMLLTG